MQPGERTPRRFPSERIDPRCVIQRNAETIRRLRETIVETFSHRHEGEEANDAWSEACAEFDRCYDALAFPGGYEDALQRLKRNDSETIDAALAFLEVRPYFFHSQYIATKLRRMLRRAILNDRQKQRLETIQFRAGPTQS